MKINVHCCCMIGQGRGRLAIMGGGDIGFGSPRFSSVVTFLLEVKDASLFEMCAFSEKLNEQFDTNNYPVVWTRGPGSGFVIFRRYLPEGLRDAERYLYATAHLVKDVIREAERDRLADEQAALAEEQSEHPPR